MSQLLAEFEKGDERFKELRAGPFSPVSDHALVLDKLNRNVR